MIVADLTKNKERIIFKIKSQITGATNENVKLVMLKMIAMLPQFESEKAILKNIDKLTMKATLSYIKNDIKFNSFQSESISEKIEIKRNESMPSSCR